MRFNPFQPNSMVRPDMFVGRADEILTIEKCLFQTKFGNPQHFLIEGERGIGKSSLLLYVDGVARGKIAPIKDIKTFNFLCVSTDVSKCSNQLQIVQSLARSLKQEIAVYDGLKDRASSFWDWITNWEFLGVKYNKPDNNIDPEVAAQELVVNIAKLMKSTDHLDGLLVLIDEADSPEHTSDLGSFLKLTAERLQREECNNVAFGIAGLPTLLTKLKLSHPSSPRLFEILTLKPLEVIEREEVLKRGINRANSRNDAETMLSSNALNEITYLSQGYPHFLQQFSYCAFEADNDLLIDMDDVISGTYSENGAIHQLGGKFFSEMYHARISSDDYRTVLNTMAEYGDEWVKRDDIKTESKLKDHTINNALGALKAKNVILHDESRRGYYRLPNRSFAVWINATKRNENQN